MDGSTFATGGRDAIVIIIFINFFFFEIRIYDDETKTLV